MNETWWKPDSTETIFLIGALALTIPMVYLFMRAARELMKDANATPPVNQRKED